MALSPDAVFPQGIITAGAVTASAVGSPATTAPTNLVELLTAGANGSIITSVKANPSATSAANVLALWASKDGGTTKYLIAQKVAAADTVSVTDAADAVDFGYSVSSPLFLAATEKLYVGIMVADPVTTGWQWRAEGRDM